MKIEEMGRPLFQGLVAQRPHDKMLYLPEATVIHQLNRLFGFGGWSFECDDPQLIHHPETGETIGYSCRGRLTVIDGDRSVVKQDVGQGFFRAGRDGVKLNHVNMAYKGAVSDSLKRCARMFGAQFGADLYSDQTYRLAVVEAVLRARAQLTGQEQQTMAGQLQRRFGGLQGTPVSYSIKMLYDALNRKPDETGGDLPSDEPAEVEADVDPDLETALDGGDDV